MSVKSDSWTLARANATTRFWCKVAMGDDHPALRIVNESPGFHGAEPDEPRLVHDPGIDVATPSWFQAEILLVVTSTVAYGYGYGYGYGPCCVGVVAMPYAHGDCQDGELGDIRPVPRVGLGQQRDPSVEDVY